MSPPAEVGRRSHFDGNFQIPTNPFGRWCIDLPLRWNLGPDLLRCHRPAETPFVWFRALAISVQSIPIPVPIPVACRLSPVTCQSRIPTLIMKGKCGWEDSLLIRTPGMKVTIEAFFPTVLPRFRGSAWFRKTSPSAHLSPDFCTQCSIGNCSSMITLPQRDWHSNPNRRSRADRCVVLISNHTHTTSQRPTSWFTTKQNVGKWRKNKNVTSVCVFVS